MNLDLYKKVLYEYTAIQSSIVNDKTKSFTFDEEFNKPLKK